MTYPAKITKALHEVMSKVGYVQKKGRNDFHRYNYAGEKDLLEVLRPAMVEAGLMLIPSVTDQSAPDEFGNTRVRVEYTLAHKDGEVWPDKIVAQGCGNDKNSKGGIGDKGTYKAITGANKYLLFKLFQIETGDDPEAKEDDAPAPAPRAANPPPAPEKPRSIPVTVDDNDQSDWKAWAEQMRMAIRTAPTLADLNAWMKINEFALGNLRKASASAADFLQQQADIQRGILVQDNPEKDAA